MHGKRPSLLEMIYRFLLHKIKILFRKMCEKNCLKGTKTVSAKVVLIFFTKLFLQASNSKIILYTSTAVALLRKILKLNFYGQTLLS